MGKEWNKMDKIESERLVLRNLEPCDFNDFLELIKDFELRPVRNGFVEVKLISDDFWKKMFDNYCHGEYGYPNVFWIYYRSENKVIGSISFGEVEDAGYIEMEQIIHSDYQNKDITKEALSMVVDYIYATMKVKTIITTDSPDGKQTAPLYDVGFTTRLVLEGSTYKRYVKQNGI